MLQKIDYKPKRVYRHDFSHNPLPTLIAFIIIALFVLVGLGRLTESERTHCMATSTNKTICNQ